MQHSICLRRFFRNEKYTVIESRAMEVLNVVINRVGPIEHNDNDGRQTRETWEEHLCNVNIPLLEPNSY